VRDGVHVTAACYVRDVGTRSGIIVAIALCTACAPTVEGPVERQRAVDREDADRLAAQLEALPGAISASVTLHRAVRDPLGVAPASAPAGVVLVVVDDAADRTLVTRTATALFVATAPEVGSPAIEVVVGAHRPTLAKVGPFSVEDRSSGPLRITLAVALAVVAALAGWIALRERPRTR